MGRPEEEEAGKDGVSASSGAGAGATEGVYSRFLVSEISQIKNSGIKYRTVIHNLILKA